MEPDGTVLTKCGGKILKRRVCEVIILQAWRMERMIVYCKLAAMVPTKIKRNGMLCGDYRSLILLNVTCNALTSLSYEG